MTNKVFVDGVLVEDLVALVACEAARRVTDELRRQREVRELPKLVGVEEMARLSSLSVSSINRLAASGRISSCKPCGRRLFDWSVVLAELQGMGDRVVKDSTLDDNGNMILRNGERKFLASGS
jgi:hypothetical protein